MYLTIDSFESFLNSEDNQELIDEGIFEFILWVPSTKSWVLKRVTDEDEMDDYLHTGNIDSDETLRALKEQHPTYPIVCLEEDVYTGDNPTDPNQETLQDTN
jgi:hypothetical protein